MFFKHKKFISFLLILCTVFSMCGQALTVFAVESSGLDDENVTTIIPSDNLQDIYFELQAEDVPELIDFNEAKEKGHVQRLREKEPDNNTIIFLNEDSTETMYVFAEPIKYTDVNGEIKDKSRTLSLVENNYTMPENDVRVYFPTNVSDGISASKGEYTVSMMPVPTISETITTDTTAVLANNKVIYSDVFGTADVLYTPLYSGFKEDIILESYNGVNEFNFFVYTNGLIPIKNENGSVSFFDPDTAESVAEMMQVVCYDANNKFAGGDIVITEIKENDIYALTVIADAAFLADENTAYPVSVDPTLSFTGTTAIEDAVVYSGKPAKNYANYNYNNIGYVDSSYKIGELLIKFPTLSSNSAFASLDDTDISSATLQLYPASGGSGNETIRAYRYNATWDESTITWNGLNFNTPPVLLDTVTVPSNTAVTTFNITQAVKTWADSDLSYISPDCGIFLINTDESDPDKCRDFLSTEYASSHSGIGMPRLAVSYSSVISPSVLYLKEGYSSQLSLRNTSGLSVSWKSDNEKVATVSATGYVSSQRAGTANITATITSSDGSTESYSSTVYVNIPTGVYYIQNCYSENYLTVEDGKIANQTDVIQYTKDESTIQSKLSQMWLVKHVTQSKYCIRPLLMNDMGLKKTTTQADIQNIGTSSSSDMENDIWSIDYYGDDTYHITTTYGETSKKALQLESSNFTNGTSVKVNTHTTLSRARWTFESVANTNIPNGIYLYDTATQAMITNSESNRPVRYLDVLSEENTPISTLKLKYTIVLGTSVVRNLTWEVQQDGNIVTVNNNGEITVHNAGTVFIKAGRLIGDEFRYIYFNVVVPETYDGNYIIGNYKDDGYYTNNHTCTFNSYKYIDVEDPQITNGTIIHQWALHGGSTQRWKITLRCDGYYTIRSVHNPSYYLYSPSGNDSIVLNAPASSVSLSDGYLWKFEYIEQNGYEGFKIIPKTGENSGKVLAIEGFGNSSSNGANLVLKTVNFDDINNKATGIWTLARIEQILDIEREESEGENYCWVATARMFSTYYSDNVTATQDDAVEVIPNTALGGTLQNIHKAINYFMYGSTSLNLVLHYSQGRIYDEYTLQRFFDDEQLIIMALSVNYIGNYTIEEPNHAVLAFGYVTINPMVSRDNEYRYLLADPVQSLDHAFKMLSYFNLCRDDNVEPEEYIQRTDWYSAVVFPTTYSHNYKQ